MADETDDQAIPIVNNDEAGMKALLGLFDVPAFARRGADLEYAIKRLNLRLARERSAMLEMVRMRLKQWAELATGPDDWPGVFDAPVAPLFGLAGLVTPAWASKPASVRKRRAAARDLIASVARFDQRWRDHLGTLKLDVINRQIDLYNRNYVFEKECVLGSARLAARHFVPKPPLTLEELSAAYPTLPVPVLSG